MNLQQYTGEHWINAKLILSTSATDVLNAGIPEPDNLIVRPPTPPTPFQDNEYKKKSKSKKVGHIYAFAQISEETAEVSDCDDEDDDDCMGVDLSCDGFVTGTPETIAPLAKLGKSAAVVSKSPMAVSYTVEALTTIPSDALSHKVLVAIIPSEAVITHITTPRKIPIAYLQVVNVTLFAGIELTRKRLLSAPSRMKAITICFPVP